MLIAVPAKLEAEADKLDAEDDILESKPESVDK
jgi:hypothetical protein